MGNTEDWVTAGSTFTNETELLKNVIPIEDG